MINDKKNKEVDVFKYGDTNINKGFLEDVILDASNIDDPKYFFVKKPSYKGMTLISMQWLPLSKIKKDKGTNTGRKKPVKEETKSTYASSIENGEYEPYNYEPPMVEYDTKDGYYKLVTGITRNGGFKLTEEKKMWVAVVKFVSFKAREIAKSLENKANRGNDFGQVTREEGEDTANSAKIILMDEESKGVEITEELVDKTLDELEIGKKEKSEAKKEVMKGFSLVSKVIDVDNSDLKIVAEEIQTNTNKKVLTRKFSAIETRNADKLNLNKFFELKETYGASYPVQIVAAFSDLTSKEIESAKFAKIDYITKEIEKIKTRYDIITDKDFTREIWNYINQDLNGSLGSKTIQKKGVKVKFNIVKKPE